MQQLYSTLLKHYKWFYALFLCSTIFNVLMPNYIQLPAFSILVLIELLLKKVVNHTLVKEDFGIVKLWIGTWLIVVLIRVIF